MKDQHKLKYVKRFIVVIRILITAFTVFPSLVFIMSPGETKTTAQWIELDHSPIDQNKQQFYYTTVLLSKANWNGVFDALFDQEKTLLLKHKLLNGLTLEEYMVRAQSSMKQSANDATIAAYSYVQIPYTLKSSGIHIMTKSARLNKNELKDGDKIVGIRTNNGAVETKDMASLLELLNENIPHYGEVIFIVESNGEIKEISIDASEQIALPLTEIELTKWLKVEQLLTLMEVEAIEEANRIQLNTERIGGASAGLIMALSIVAALHDDTIQTPYKVAATGTIDIDGQVGLIGSIEQKVVSVSEAGIDLFIVPDELENIAQKKAESINSTLQIVGVASLEEAVIAINSFKK